MNRLAVATIACALAAGLALAGCARNGPARGLDPELTTYRYPYPVQRHALTSQRQQLAMAYVDVAPTGPANGRVALLLHGKNFSAAYWAPTIERLARAGFRVIAPDQIGFGKSSKPERYQFSFETLVANTRELLDALGVSQVTVIGHSMGGMLAARFALMEPARTERLVLINPIGLEDYRAHVPARTVDQLYTQELAQTPEKIRDYQRRSYYDGQWKPAYEALIEILAGWTQHPAYPRVAWNAALTSEMIYAQPVVQDLARIQAPTLLIIGQRDRTAIGKDRVPAEQAATLGDYPALGRATAARIAGARLVELPGVGHLPQIEAFDAYIEALLAFVQ
ncbi:MAG: alpha/beta fold hydrolase [Kofleriaceae bacterium]